MKKTGFLFFSLSILIAVCALCGCTAQEQTSTASTGFDIKDNLYIHSRNNQWGVLNTAGEFVIEPQEYQLDILRDAFTQAPKYIQATKIIPGEKDEEYEIYWDNDYQTALYDTEGNLIYDFAPGYFYNVFGDYLSMYREGKNQLINMKTGEQVMDLEDSDIQVFNHYITVSRYDKPGIKIYNENMEFIKELPDYYLGYSLKNNDNLYFIVRDKDQHAGLCDADFHLIVPCEYRWINEINGNYLLAEDLSQCGVAIDITTGETVMATDPSENIYYYDGNLALVTTSDQSGQRTYSIIHLKDESNKIQTYPYISVINSGNQNHMAKGFLVKTTDDQQMILDPNGEVFLNLISDCWVYGNDTENYIVEYYSGENHRPVEIYKPDGTQLPLPKDYLSINSMYYYTDLPYLEAGYRDHQDNWRIDILDKDGNLLIENLQIYSVTDFESYYCDGYRILARKGFSQGMMDMKGNWIYKESIFNSLGNEY